MRIAIDLDDVCFDFLKSFATFYGKPKFPTEESLDKQYPQLEMATIKKAFSAPEVYYHARPMDLAASVLRTMVRLHDIEYLSARPEEMIWVSKLSLCEHDFPFAPVHLFGTSLKKIAYIREQGFDVVFDDMPNTIRKVADKVRMPIIYTAPWNQNFEWKLRVNDWKDIFTLLIQP